LLAGKRDLQFEKVISDVTADMKLTRDDDFTLRVVQLSELLAIRHCVFLMGPTGSGRTEVYKVSERHTHRAAVSQLVEGTF
jgi:dynein heavy chain